MITLKNFQLYDSKMIAGSSILFLKDESGLDWYESQANFGKKTLKFVFDENGIIISFDYDVSRLWPVGNSVSEVSKVPAGLDINGDWAFDGKKIFRRTYTSDELIEQATAKRNALLAEANTAITPLQDAVDVDDATDDELAALKAWKKYRVALNRLDLSTAPDITWPEVPQ